MTIKSERDLTAKFSFYLRKNKNLPSFLKQSFCVEIKLLKKARLNLKSDLRPQQIPSLLQANRGCLYFKLPDGADGGSRPFDAFQSCNVAAYLAIAFHDDDLLYFINASAIERLTAKSLSREDIKNLACEIICLKV